MARPKKRSSTQSKTDQEIRKQKTTKGVGFKGNPNLLGDHESIRYTKKQIAEIIHCMDDPIYFTENYVKIVNVDRGLILFDPYNYQKELIESVSKFKRVIAKFFRQGGKTTAAAAAILHYILFNKSKTVAICANKAASAKEILDRIKIMYENLPRWMQVPVLVWNKTEIKLGNGTVVFTSATGGSSIRGRSCVTGDSLITVRNKRTGQIETLPIEQLKNAIEPETTYFIDDYEIFDGETFRDFEGISVSEQKVFEVVAERGTIRATGDHRFLTSSGEWIECESLTTKTELKYAGRVISVTALDNIELVYDPVNVGGDAYLANGFKNHNCSLLYLDEFAHVPRNIQNDFMASVYPTITSGQDSKIIVTSTPNGFDLFHKIYKQAEQGLNGYTIVDAHWSDIPGRGETWKQDQINHLGSEEKFEQEFNCTFLGSSLTLINPRKLAELVPMTEPEEKNETTRIFKYPENGHIYMISLDSSEGIGQDYHAGQIIDITSSPYEQVAIFHTNTVRYTAVPNFIDFLAKKYNDAYILVELNSTGMEIANLLYNDLENENIVSTMTKKNTQTLSAGFSGTSKLGLKTTKSTKSLGCLTLKTLIERDQLIVHDENTINELFNYVESKKGFFEGDGTNDDTVAALVNFAWASSQPLFESFTNLEVKQKLLEEAERQAEEELSFFGFIDDGSEEFDDLDGLISTSQQSFESAFSSFP